METTFGEMKRFVGFTREDEENLARVRPLVAPHYAWIADEFYRRVQAHPAASRVFTGPEQVRRLKATLQSWADRLLSGPYDEEYFQIRSRIGRAHVGVGLKQMYMFTAMNVMRQSFDTVLGRELAGDPDRLSRVSRSLDKILDLELGIMLETYREDYVGRIHQSEQQAALKRLAAIGEVAASLAHEVRNPLAAISGAIEVLRDDLPADSPRREVIKEMLGLVRRLDERVRDLLQYSRRVNLSFQEVDPAELIQGTMSLVAGEPLMGDIRVTTAVAPGIGVHAMDRGQMQEVLLNLIRNATEAMGGRGEMRIEASRGENQGLVLVVDDSGPGVPPDRAEAIFAPFYTSRPDGTGLGLSIARRTVEAHGGSLTLEAGSLGGARFVVSLPAMVVSKA